ncbi:MAG: hypothetical protein QI223_03440, partial [Candidatus Korarchaeota archaeon]|nr:hypothetical protein [Candidatus Korarchaeota archaeon]
EYCQECRAQMEPVDWTIRVYDAAGSRVAEGLFYAYTFERDGLEWKRYYLPFYASLSYEAGTWSAVFKCSPGGTCRLGPVSFTVYPHPVGVEVPSVEVVGNGTARPYLESDHSAYEPDPDALYQVIAKLLRSGRLLDRAQTQYMQGGNPSTYRATLSGYADITEHYVAETFA